jgi:hypothetical protein
VAAFPLAFVEREADFERDLATSNHRMLRTLADALVIAFWTASETLVSEVPTSSISL